MRFLFFIFFTLSIAFSQCDANNDSQLDVLDIIVQVDCILNDCWQTLDFSELILGSWVLDSTYYTSPYGDQTESYCGQLGYYGDTGLIFTFDNNGDLFINEMDIEYCGMDEVSISNNDYYYNNPSFFDSYTINQNNLNLGFMQFEIVNLDQNNLIIYRNSEVDGETQSYFHRVSILDDLEYLPNEKQLPINLFNQIIK